MGWALWREVAGVITFSLALFYMLSVLVRDAGHESKLLTNNHKVSQAGQRTQERTHAHRYTHQIPLRVLCYMSKAHTGLDKYTVALCCVCVLLKTNKMFNLNAKRKIPASKNEANTHTFGYIGCMMVSFLALHLLSLCVRFVLDCIYGAHSVFGYSFEICGAGAIGKG